MTFPGESEATWNTGDRKIDVGLLALRIGIGLSFVLPFVLKQAEGTKIFIFYPGRLWPCRRFVGPCVFGGVWILD